MVFLIVLIVSGIYFFARRPVKLQAPPPVPAQALVEKKNPILDKVRSATARRPTNPLSPEESSLRMRRSG